MPCTCRTLGISSVSATTTGYLSLTSPESSCPGYYVLSPLSSGWESIPVILRSIRGVYSSQILSIRIKVSKKWGVWKAPISRGNILVG